MSTSTAAGGGGMHDPTQGDNLTRKPASSVAEQSRAAGIGAENINDFLDRQSPAILNRLYAKPASCLAIFRLLPMLARQLVMQMLFLDSPLKWEDWNAQLTKEGRRQRERTLKRLKSLVIIRESGDTRSNSAERKLQMNGVFQSNMRRALIGGGEHRSFGVLSDTEDSHAVDVPFLDNYSKTKWEAILHFLVGSEGFEPPREPVLYLLQKSGLMQTSGGSTTTNAAHLSISARGFQFLLEDVNTQLWDLLLQYLAVAEPRGMDLVEVMSFLFMLGSLELGKDYSTEELSETQLHMLEDFRDYGLVYQRKSSSRRFYPTRLATTLTSNASPIVSNVEEAEEKGYVILETNYRIYAYTSNPLRIAVLNLFVTLKSRFPNLVMGVITRDSVKSALANGITAEQIIAYLTHHAHPQMWKNDPLLPVTVTDQIRLWEREKNRVASEEGSLYTDFTSLADFELVRNYAKESGVLLWQNEETRKFFVTSDGTGLIRDFIKRRLM